MADGNSHPFNSDLVAGDILNQSHKQQSSQFHQPTSNAVKNLLEILSSNNTSNHFLNTNDPSTSISSQVVSDDEFDRLKSIVRSTLWPIDHSIRRHLWINILTLNRVSTSKNTAHHSSSLAASATSIVADPHFTSSSPKPNQWPSIVDASHLTFYHLNESKGRLALQRVLFTFALNHPDVTYCPALAPFTSLLLHYFTENEVSYLINRLLDKRWLLGETHLQWEANWNVFKNLLKVFHKSTAETVESRFTNSKSFYQEWFWWIFYYLPFPYIVKIMDCFFIEGPKIVYRVALTIAHLFIKTSKTQTGQSDRTIAEFCQQIPVTIEQLLRNAFQIRNLKKRTIEQITNQEERVIHKNRVSSRLDDFDLKNSNNNNNNNNNISSSVHGNIIDTRTSFAPLQHLIRCPPASILTHEQFTMIWNWLPARLTLCQPDLVFTTETDGFRLQTLLERIANADYSILVVKSTRGEIFGAFCAGQWTDRQERMFFGFGESFLFSLTPQEVKYSWVGQKDFKETQLSEAQQRQSQVKRELFLFANQEKLVVGGGDGDGLCIDASLCEGRTERCQTFNNEPLCSTRDFSISVLEMITFDFS